MIRNEMPVSRRDCLVRVPAALGVVAGWSLMQSARGAQTATEGPRPPLPESFPSQDPRLVSEMVGASHARTERVRALLAEAPQLANATWDWGFGDWESALGAASHVGHREIATMLIAHGARPDIFAWAMLGNLDAVKACVSGQSGIERMRGPHGLTLMHHARAGGDEAASVVEFLRGLPGSDERPAEMALPDTMRDAILGEYAWADDPDARLRVFITERQKKLAVTRGAGGARLLTYLGEATFQPAGAADVRLRFTIEGAKATRLTITTPAPLLDAVRVA